MSSRVGAKGNIVIDKRIRDHLGVQPGWETVQLLRDGHVEVHFLPPVDVHSSSGCLRPETEEQRAWLKDEDTLHEAIEQAFAEALAERFGLPLPEPAS